jgi:RNA polymerase sigma-70 factor (ECF subfamily)
MEQREDELHHDDLVWARELATGSRDALDRYERELAPIIAGQLRRRGFVPDLISELQQALRMRLFVGDGSGPAIASYAGRGSLKSWVLVAALREAVRMRQRELREPALEDDALLALADREHGEAGPELDKERYRQAFRDGFRVALRALPPRDRTLLRMSVLDELSIDQIGAILGVHRATAARWLAAAREAVSQGVRRELTKTLGTDPFETESLIRWIQSRLDLSLGGLMKNTTVA